VESNEYIKSKMNSLSLEKQKLNFELYKKIFLIRRAEESICRYYPEDEMKTPMHMSMGEEAIAAGVCHALKKKDQIFGTYRSHAIFLAKTQDVGIFFAEMYSKDTSILKGKGGSMHLSFPEYGFMGTSAIVASHIPVAVGAAFAQKYHSRDRVVVVFFGDGAIDEGGFWESLNLACLMKLPVVFVCEDNGFAVHTAVSQRRGYKDITRIISGFNCNVFEHDSTDVEKIYLLSLKALQTMRKNHKPCFINLRYYRYLEHVGINYDFDAGYRSTEEFDKWRRKDPIALQRKKLLGLGIKEEIIQKAEKQIDRRIAASIALAKKAPLSGNCELYRGVFS
jgi:acetoin:2,6-dichlorophenolindophenol oxidoreductase subunit alpha